MKRLLLVFLSGCAFQATAGPTAAGLEKPVPTATVGVTMHALRKSNGIVGLRMGSVVNDGFVPKHGILHGGYDVIAVPGWLELELGPDIGAGSAVTHLWDGIGAYGGASGTARLRLLGTGDREPSFDVAFPMLELVLMPRMGMWMPPERSDSRTPYGEFGVELGLRLAVGSDLAGTAQGKPQDADKPRDGQEDEAKP
jgi:hypothetical protein